MTSQSLAGEWSLVDVAGEHACPMVLPGDGISALYDAGLIPDPYWGRNEYDLRWICARDWVASRDFVLDETDVDLVLSCVDTVATVTVNGVVVAHLQNAFRSYRVPLADIARQGENRIAITFHSPVDAGRARQDAHPFEIPWSKNCPIPYGNFLRKPACDFGWDWNIALAPFGIYGCLLIEPVAAPRIDRLAVSQTHADDSVTVRVTAEVVHHDGPVTFAMGGVTMTAPVVSGTCTADFRIEEPELWWPAGQGAQPLYKLVVSAGPATTTRRIGLRKIELITEKDAAGLSFGLRVNGRDVFCKGANWIPADALPGRIHQDKTRALLQSAVDANMNMIRVWGGGRYEPDSFYDACDELGLMVWQDFMFSCNLYPSDPAFLAEVTAEVRENVARMHHHACLALWCGDNELIGALGWYDVSLTDRDRYLVNYDRLNRCIENALRETDPGAVWWPSSPSPGPLNFGDAWHDDGSGDMHFWSVWHEGRDFDHYRDVSPRFCSEFGFQSYPLMSTIRRFAGPEDFNIAAPVLESHQKNTGGNARIAETMFRYFRWPRDFADFAYVSQIQQGLAIKTAVTHWRSLRPHCMGTLIWQLNDTWPVCSWSSLDHGGAWKLMHHMAQGFFAPVLVAAVPDADEIILRAVNDRPAPITLTVKANVVSMDGTTRPLTAATATVDATAVEVLRIARADLGPQDMLAFTWAEGENQLGGDVFAPHPYKHYDLAAPGLTHSLARDGSNHLLTISAKALAHFVCVEADTPGQFDRNAFALFPGYPATVRFTPADPESRPQFILRDLHSATYA